MNFSRHHFSTIMKYVGISFITGAISHGFFSENRSIITGILGIVIFGIGTLLEEEGKNIGRALIIGSLLAIGIGSFTGGIQHFPDSPDRSVWITPIGFISSLIFFSDNL